MTDQLFDTSNIPVVEPPAPEPETWVATLRWKSFTRVEFQVLPGQDPEEVIWGLLDRGIIEWDDGVFEDSDVQVYRVALKTR